MKLKGRLYNGPHVWIHKFFRELGLNTFIGFGNGGLTDAWLQMASLFNWMVFKGIVRFSQEDLFTGLFQDTCFKT